MIDEATLQSDFFDYIRNQLPKGDSLVEEISEVLSISSDSAYRRIRGDKLMVLPEIVRLSEHFEISINEVIEVSNPKLVSFSTQFINEESNSIDHFFRSLKSEMDKVKNAKEGKFVFLINDLNLFQLLQVPELAAFKFFFWQKSGLGFEGMKEENFSLDKYQHGFKEIINQVTSSYIKVNTVELVSSSMISSAIKQIEYYFDMGFIPKKTEAVYLLEKLIDMADHLCQQAENGQKFAYGYSKDLSNGDYNLYYNDLMSVDNTILGKYDGQVVSYLTNNLVNVMKTTNRQFYNYNLKIVENLIKRSELLSLNSERKRTKVFNSIKQEIRDSINRL